MDLMEHWIEQMLIDPSITVLVICPYILYYARASCARACLSLLSRAPEAGRSLHARVYST